MFVRARDDAAWRVGERIRRRAETHDRRVRRTRRGCRIRACVRPVEAPRRNPIAPGWMHGTRALVEPGRNLAGDEVRRRVCDYYGCPQQPTLPKPQT